RPAASRSCCVLAISRRVAPSTRYLRFDNRPPASRTAELLPSAPTMRSALSLRPSASTSSPSALAPVATEPVTISAPARVAAAASALMTVWRTMLNTRLPSQRCTEISRLRSSRTSRVWAKGAPLTPPALGPPRREHAQPVLVDVDTRAGGAQALPALVHAHAPIALRERAGRGQACETRAGDFGVPFHGAILWH